MVPSIVRELSPEIETLESWLSPSVKRAYPMLNRATRAPKTQHAKHKHPNNKQTNKQEITTTTENDKEALRMHPCTRARTRTQT